MEAIIILKSEAPIEGHKLIKIENLLEDIRFEPILDYQIFSIFVKFPVVEGINLQKGPWSCEEYFFKLTNSFSPKGL